MEEARQGRQHRGGPSDSSYSGTQGMGQNWQQWCGCGCNSPVNGVNTDNSSQQRKTPEDFLRTLGTLENEDNYIEVAGDLDSDITKEKLEAYIEANKDNAEKANLVKACEDLLNDENLFNSLSGGSDSISRTQLTSEYQKVATGILGDYRGSDLSAYIGSDGQLDFSAVSQDETVPEALRLAAQFFATYPDKVPAQRPPQ